MIIGFVIWSSVFLSLLGIGFWAWKSDKPVGFYAGVNPPKVIDVQKYNHSVGRLWLCYAILFELLGLPFLFLKQNSAGFLVSVLGTVAITIALVAVYNRILYRFEKRDSRSSGARTHSDSTSTLGST